MRSDPNSISALEVYTISEACRRLNWGRKTFWRAEEAGLRAVAFGRAKYVRGAEILRFFRQMESTAADMSRGALV